MPEILEAVFARLSVLVSKIGLNVLGYHKMLVDQVGEKLAMGIYLCAAILILLVVFKVFKLAFNILRFVIIPSVVVAYIGSMFLSLSFLAAMPVAGALFSVLFFIKS